MDPAAFYQSETDTFLHGYGISICGNDYTATNSKSIRNLFVTASATNLDPRPVFVAINCVSNSPSHAHWQVLLREFYNRGRRFDFTARIVSWRNIIDSMQAPPPLITGARLSGSASAL